MLAHGIQQSYASTFSLSAAGCELSSPSLRLFAGAIALMPVLTRIDLSCNEFDDNDLGLFLQTIATNSTLTHLALDQCQGSGSRKGLRPAVVEGLCALFDSDVTRLETLSIAWCQLRASAVPILLGLSRSSRLQSIDISGNGIGDHGAAALAVALRCSGALRRVLWDDNAQTVPGLRMVLAAVPKAQCLVEMPLPLTDIAAAAKTPGIADVAAKLVQALLARRAPPRPAPPAASAGPAAVKRRPRCVAPDPGLPPRPR